MSVFQTKEKSIHSWVQFQLGRQQSAVAVTTFREDCPDFFFTFSPDFTFSPTPDFMFALNRDLEREISDAKIKSMEKSN